MVENETWRVKQLVMEIFPDDLLLIPSSKNLVCPIIHVHLEVAIFSYHTQTLYITVFFYRPWVNCCQKGFLKNILKKRLMSGLVVSCISTKWPETIPRHFRWLLEGQAQLVGNKFLTYSSTHKFTNIKNNHLKSRLSVAVKLFSRKYVVLQRATESYWIMWS